MSEHLDFAPLGRGFRAPRCVRVRTAEGVTLDLEVDAGRYVVRSVHARRITGDLLRAIRPSEVIYEAAAPLVEVNRSGRWGQWVPPSPEVARRGPSQEALRALAEVYWVAQALDRPPRNAVADWFGLTRPTAGRWIMTARAKGYLPPANPPARSMGP